MAETAKHDGNRILRCEEEVSELCREHYTEINPRDVAVFFEVVNNDAKIGAHVKNNPWSCLKKGYEIRGTVPVKSVEDGCSSRLIKAVLGHELAHIANGDVDSLIGYIALDLSRLPMFGQLIRTFMEHRADKEVIRRGLGEELLWACDYFNSLGKRPLDIEHYSTSKLRQLVAKHNRGKSR